MTFNASVQDAASTIIKSRAEPSRAEPAIRRPRRGAVLRPDRPFPSRSFRTTAAARPHRAPGRGGARPPTGYGLSGPREFGIITPYTGLSLTGGAERTLKAGARWNASESATVTLEATECNRRHPSMCSTARNLPADRQKFRPDPNGGSEPWRQGT